MAPRSVVVPVVACCKTTSPFYPCYTCLRKLTFPTLHVTQHILATDTEQDGHRNSLAPQQIMITDECISVISKNSTHGMNTPKKHAYNDAG